MLAGLLHFYRAHCSYLWLCCHQFSAQQEDTKKDPRGKVLAADEVNYCTLLRFMMEFHRIDLNAAEKAREAELKAQAAKHQKLVPTVAGGVEQKIEQLSNDQGAAQKQTQDRISGIEQKIERLETQQAETLAKFQQDIRATLQAILAASQMTDSERAAAEENRGSSSDENDSSSDDEQDATTTTAREIPQRRPVRR